MKVRITARHFNLTDDLKQHVETRSEHFTKFFDNIIDLHWVLDVENRRHTAEITAKVFGTVLTGKSEGVDFRTAVDETAHKMESQIRKYKGRLKERDPKAITAAKEAAATAESESAAGGDDDE